MSNVPADLRYAKSHEWLKLAGDGTATVGISDYAQNSLGDITYVQMPKVGATLKAGETFGVVESVKAASDIYAPVSGEVTEANAALADSPGDVNAEPMGKGWFFKLKLSDKSELDGLMDEAAYQAFVKSLG